MQIVLTEEVTRLGLKGDVVKVRDGFFRNYLAPQSKAVIATAQDIKRFEKEKEKRLKLHAEKKKAAEAFAERFEGVTLEFKMKTAEDSDKLYGSVSVQDVLDALKAKGIEVEKQQIDLDGTVKTIGSYSAGVVLHPEVKVLVPFQVVKG